MTRLRVKLYAPHVPTSSVAPFPVRAARFLGDHCDRVPGLEFSATGTAGDESGSPLRWPAARFTPLAAEELRADPSGVDAYSRLTAVDARPFDVLFLPCPWAMYPASRLGATVAPFVAYVADLDFDDADLGPVTDTRRQVMATLARECAAVVFPSAAVRDRAVRRYGIPAERAFVVAPTRSIDAAPVGPPKSVAGLDVPSDFVVLLDPRQASVPQELRQSLHSAGLDWPVVVLDRSIDGSREDSSSIDSEPGVVRPGRLSDDEYRTLLSRATAVVADTLAPRPWFDTPHLDALSLRTPLFCRAGSESDRWAGDTNGVAILFREIGEVAGHLDRLRDAPRSFDETLSRGEAIARSRGEADAARELFEIFRGVHETPAARRVRFRATPQVCREKRILRLIDDADGPSEVRLLESLGYEVYTPEFRPGHSRGPHAGDAGSTLPRWVLEHLGRHDFIRFPMSPEVAELLNGYFGTAIVPVHGTAAIEAVEKFCGRIVARPPGREHPAVHLARWGRYGEDFLRRVRTIRHRFWLAAPHDAVGGWSPEFLRDHTSTLPLAVAEHVRRNEDRWTGSDSRILIVPMATDSTARDAGRATADFGYHFGDLPHVVAAAEAVSARQLNELRVLCDLERDPRYLHEHTLRALVHGMPVVFLADGPLAALGGKHQPGACETEADARRVIRRILDGGRELIDAIRQKQSEILRPFAEESVRSAWAEKFVGGVMATPVAPDSIPPSRWTEVTSQPPVVAGPSGAFVAVARVGVCAGDSRDPESLRHASILAEAVAATSPAARVELHVDRRAPRPVLSPVKRPNLSTRTFAAKRRLALPNLGTRLFLPRTSARRSGTASLTFDQVRRIAARNEVTVIVDPVDLLAADQPIDSVHELPVVVAVGDLAHEFAPDDGRSLARHREMRLWSKIARRFVFGSEHLRREGVRRYGIPEEKTAVISLPPFVAPRGPASPDETAAMRRRLRLPAEYVLTPAATDPNVNTLAVLEAAAVMKWRRGKTPAVVLAGRDATRLVRLSAADAYAAKVRDVIREARLTEGEDFFLVDQVPPADLASLNAGASAYVTVARLDSQVHGTVHQALLAKCPVVCGATPAYVEQLGPDGDLASLVPPDDPAALADALAGLTADAEETRRRIDRAFTWAKRHDGRAAIDHYRRVIAAAAASTPDFAAALVVDQRRTAA